MPLLPGIAETNISEFRGAVPRLGDYGTPLTNGLYSQNVAYSPGQVSKRYGHSTMFTITADGAALTLANWYFYFGTTPVIVALYYSAANGLRGYDLTVPSFASIINVTGAAGASLVPAGQRLYATFYDSTGRIASAANVGTVYGWNIGEDPLFAAPMANTMTITEPSAGVVTAGQHRIAYLPTTRNGFTTKTSPVIAGAFTPTTFTAAGSKNLQVVIGGTFPSYMGTPGTLQLCMTPTTNLNKYYTVPGATTPSLSPATLTADIDDDDLIATGTDVTDQVNLLTCSNTTAPYGAPFNPSSVFAYSNRMCYATVDSLGIPTVFISDKNDFQHITADQHAVYLEAHDLPVHGISLGGVLYIGSPFCFYSVTDSGDVPVNWTPPQKVYGSVGILSPTCVSVDASQTRAIIASQQGLYLFQGGQFPTLPISYFQNQAWNRIDWTTPTLVQVVEDQTKKKFIVIAPLVADSNTDPATSAAGTYEMSWDYTEGDTPDRVKYSINPYDSYEPRSLAMILNPSTFILEAWTGPANNGPVIRENDGSETYPFRDVDMSGNPAAIDAIYETALIPGEDGSIGATMHNFHGAHFRVVGEGNMAIRADGVDNSPQITPARSPLPLDPTPGQEELVKWFLRSEQQSIRFSNSVIDEWFTMSLVRGYWTDAMPIR